MYKKVCIEDISTTPWTIQSFGYETMLDAKMAAAKLFTVKHGAMVKPYKDKWAVLFLGTAHENNNQR